MKNKLTSIVAAAMLSIGCAGVTTQPHFVLGLDKVNLIGFKIQQMKDRFEYGIDVMHGKTGTSEFEDELELNEFVSLDVTGVKNSATTRLSIYAGYRVLDHQENEYVSFRLSIGGGAGLDIDTSSTDYTLGEDGNIGKLPSSLDLTTRLFAQAQYEMKFWNIPIHYNFRVNTKGEISNHVSVGYEF